MGNKTYTYDWANPIGSLLAFGADVANAVNGEEALMKILRAGVKAGINTMFGQSYLESMSDVFGAENFADGIETFAY